MSYQVIARKYRPSNFQEVTGQLPVTRSLLNAVRTGRIAHAYLFSGPRGVGKTSVARIFAKAVNCTQSNNGEPCLECKSCTEITKASSLAVYEIDGASHNSVDNVRDLIDSFRTMPPSYYSFKVYIIDEVHMLSSAAFNALLKSLEEPPPQTLFILATTEPHKILNTVLSRCQHYEFRSIQSEHVKDQLKAIAEKEKVTVDEESLNLIARLSEGSMRDAQSLFDRVLSFCDGSNIAIETVTQVLGAVQRGVLSSICRAILERDASEALLHTHESLSEGLDVTLLIEEFLSYWRQLFFLRFISDTEQQTNVGVTPEVQQEFAARLDQISKADMQQLFTIAREQSDRALRSSYPRYALESLIVLMATREPLEEIGALIGSVKGLLSQQARHNAGAQNAGAPSQPPHAHSHAGPQSEDTPEHAQPHTSLPKSAAAVPSQKPVRGVVKKLEVTSNAHSSPVSALEKSYQDLLALASSSARSNPKISAEDPGQTSVDKSQESIHEPTGLPAQLEQEWRKFVAFVSQKHSAMLGQQLRLAVPEHFGKGSLRCKCGPFSYSYFARAENKEILESLLKKFTGVSHWNIQITELRDGESSGNLSLAETEKRRRQEGVAKKEREISEHPAIQTFQKVFPGSRPRLAGKR